MKLTFGIVSIVCLSMLVKGQVYVYEGDVLPVDGGWNPSQRVCDPETWLEGCCYHQIVDHRSCAPPGGGFESFRRSLSDYLGKTRFFLEVRIEADGPREEIPWGGPGIFALGSNAAVAYTFFIARDQAKLNRDNRLPIIFVDIEPGVPHTHRLESYDDDLYIWYIDGVIVDSGVPEGPFPSFTPSISWSAQSHYFDNVVHWDYIRYGRIAEDGSGDFDSDGDIDLFDVHYFVECLESSGPLAGTGPGCRWADLDGDTDTDLRDFSKLQNQFNGAP